jgi:hypothetical protein
MPAATASAVTMTAEACFAGLQEGRDASIMDNPEWIREAST